MKRRHLFGWLCAIPALAGCDDPLKSVELVTEPRILGGRVEVKADSERAAPAPGESATFSLLVASPDSEQSYGYALSACSAALDRGTRATCAAPAFARASGNARTPSLDFEVPAEIDPDGRVAILGVVCPAGAARADGAACDEGPSLPLELALELGRGADANRNPELPAAALAFDDEPWPDLPLPDGACLGLGLPELAPDSTHELRVELAESDRDQLPATSSLEPTRETLQLSHFISAGDVTRAFETIAWNQDELSRRVSFTAPAEPGLVRIWFVLRDFRGGGAFASRAVCVR